MECNKDEAFKAKEIAEQKLKDRDFVSAKKFAMKAQRLYPSLDGIQQLMATLEVYICAEERTNGEVDWYRVLGVEPSADDDTIRKQYRKLALTLHPDKNKSVGADEAFTLISEAWGLLSDNVKRLNYDNRLNVANMHANASGQRNSVPTAQNDHHNINNNVHAWFRNSASQPRPAPAAFKPNPSNFWTSCYYCKKYFLLPRTHLKKYAPCLNCNKAYFTIEVPPPPIDMQGVHLTHQPRTENPFAAGANRYSYMQEVKVTHNGSTKSPNAVGTRPDCSSNMQSVNPTKYRKIVNSHDFEIWSNAYRRPVVMGLASTRSGTGVRNRVTASSAAGVGKFTAPGSANLSSQSSAGLTSKKKYQVRTQQ